MGRSLNPLLAPVACDHHSVVDREPLVGVHGDAEEPRVGLSPAGYTCQHDLMTLHD